MYTTEKSPEGSEMHVDAERAKTLVSALMNVTRRINTKAAGRNVQLVAVSKLKPASDIQALYDSGHRHFGENYAQELIEKSTVLPKDIKWHFIGGLQSNKCKSLASSIPNLSSVSSVDSAKKANLLNLGRACFPDSNPMNIHIQVNTSSEPSKSGSPPGEATAELALHILQSCPNLQLKGLMTIGAIARSIAVASGQNDNEDFRILRDERDSLEEILRRESKGKDWETRWGTITNNKDATEADPIRTLELSMGMSDDFELAVEMGSNEVRVGSTIFGQRNVKNKD
ncbi:unnamed protein product [Blumeria hordei]|uniref:Pyridoxal phosphate homeostasis protein n=1 Tax=Blumeria hordei TaxID=2867405 RepID=A0A383V2Q1_BLUHO|nr:unnamed protein product [Blumeria hordei]